MKAFGSEYALRPGWTRLQSLYIRIFGIVDLPTRIRARYVLRALKTLTCDTVLDLGAGTGVYSLFLTRNPRCKVLAIDIDSGRAESIRHQARCLRRSNLEVLCSSEDGLETLPSGSFSLVLTVEVLPYFADLNRVLLNLKNCLLPGGTLVAHIPFRDGLWPYEHNLFDEQFLRTEFMKAGFESPDIRRTFGAGSQLICNIFSGLVERPLLLALVYPALLCIANLLSGFSTQGTCCLLITRRPLG